MSKIAHYLQEHLVGEVNVSPDVRRHFSQDASVLQLMPLAVVYPRNENDIRKTARFSWQLAERGKIVPLTARGAGSDVTGAALGNGILLVFTAHMNKILAFDPRKEVVEVEPGINYDKLQQALFTHGFFLPAYPSSAQYATIGGSIANNSSGEKSVKYGNTLEYVEKLRVILANGEVIETGRLNKKELSKKMGLSSFEGEVYRALDALIDENADLIKAMKDHIKAVRNSAGYDVFDVKRKDGSFDLTPLIVGSQGTLGIVSEAKLKLEPHNPTTSLAILGFSELAHLTNALPKILELNPSSIEMINRHALQQIANVNPNQLLGVLENPSAAITLFVEFDDFKDSVQKKDIKKLQKIAEKFGALCQVAYELEDQQRFWKVRQGVATLLSYHNGPAKSVPVAEDIAVPQNEIVDFLERAEKIYHEQGMVAAAWGHAGEGIIHMQPVLNLAQLGDRQKLFRLSEDIYKLALELGGTISASHGDGRVRAPYLTTMYGADMVGLFEKIKHVFDPYGIMNPGVKVGGTTEQVKELLRNDYGLAHRFNYEPHS